MSVIIKYILDFAGAGFKVSNDAFRGDFLIDASVRAVMSPGAAGGTFEIKLSDLPESKANLLFEKAKNPKDARVTIKLGYMDGDFDTVMEGVYTDVSATVEGDSFVTTVKGEESATYALRKRFQDGFEGKIKFTDAVNKLLKEAFPEAGGSAGPTGIVAAIASLLGDEAGDGKEIDQTAKVENVEDEVEDVSLKGESLMEILNNLARSVGAEFFVYDKKVRIGRPVTDNRNVDEFSPDRNLAKFQPLAKGLPGEEGDNRLKKVAPDSALGFKFIVTGDPLLRPAQKVFASVDGYRKKNDADFRILSLVHSLNMTGGYTCEGKAVKACKKNDEECRRQREKLGLNNPDSIAQKLADKTRDELTRRPALEVGTVKSHNAGDAAAAPHRTTLFYEQRFPKSETQPSVRAEVEAREKQLFRNKPVVSPFAWHRCGLVVPVYPGMKALLGHNLNLTNDALVSGFIWSEKPTIEPPKSKEGDWWLCLPIDFGAANPLPDSTKAVNDLIANNGKRVIELKGLKLTIGTDKLQAVGERPTEGADDELLIEHKSGTKLQISSDGSLTIEAKKVSVKGDVTFEGNVEIK
jgi:hypothetical protein